VALASDTIKRVFRNVSMRAIPFSDERRENGSAHLHVQSTIKNTLYGCADRPMISTSASREFFKCLHETRSDEHSGEKVSTYLSAQAFSRRDNTTLRIFSKLAMSCSTCRSFHSTLYAVGENNKENRGSSDIDTHDGSPLFCKTDGWGTPSSPS
jgi:hypothetical protein